MPSLKTLTVRYLRELARKHLGRGHSKLKTREELLAALRNAVPGILQKEAQDAPAPAPAPARADAPKVPPAEVIHFDKRAQSPAERRVGNGAEDQTQTRKKSGNDRAGLGSNGEDGPVERAKSQPEASRAQAPSPAALTSGGALSQRERGASKARPRQAPRPLPLPSVPAEPVVEGFFVARIAGEDEVRRHRLSAVHPPPESSSASTVNESLPPLPLRYETDRVVLLARDPGSVFAFWDLAPQTRGASARAQLRLLEGEEVLRSVEVPLDAPSWYLYGVPAGRTVKVALWDLTSDPPRQLGPQSNPVSIPADDLSSDTSVRFMSVPPDVHLLRLRDRRDQLAPERTPQPAPEPLSLEVLREKWEPTANSGSWQLRTWMERVPLPQGAQAQEGPTKEGERPLTTQPYPLGGSSSFTLTSSFGLGNPSSHSGSGRGGRS